MCRADTALFTFHWNEQAHSLQADLTSKHQCSDWDALMNWAAKRRIPHEAMVSLALHGGKAASEME